MSGAIPEDRKNRACAGYRIADEEDRNGPPLLPKPTPFQHQASGKLKLDHMATKQRSSRAENTPRHRGKVFGIGLSKTGTTSLFVALDILGYRSATYRHMRKLGLSNWFRGEFRTDYLSRFDAVTDLPIGTFFRELDRRYPGSKFILTVRDKQAWLNSCHRFFFGREQQEDDFYKRVQLATYGTFEFDAERFSATWDRLMERVAEYFANRPEDLLVMDVFGGDGWDVLCRFLNSEVPTVAFPRVHPGHRLSGAGRIIAARGMAFLRSAGWPALNHRRAIQRARRGARSIICQLGFDIEPGPRSLMLHDRAYQEAGRLPPAPLRPYALRYPRSWIDRIAGLPREKLHDFSFVGSLLSSDVSDRRKWVIAFLRQHATDRSILVCTDSEANTPAFGLFDRTAEFGANRFRPKDVPRHQRAHFDSWYYTVACASEFVLCPAGDRPWSMRFFEAILCRSIPIVESPKHSGRNRVERSIGYKYFSLDEPDGYAYRVDWVEENYRRLLKNQSVEPVGLRL